MKFLLTTLNAKYIHTNLAIRLLYHLNKNEFPNLEWKEFTIKENIDIIGQYCSNYQLVAFSCYIWNIHQTLEVCKKIKQLSPNTQILLGGPEVSYEWKEILQLDYVDFIIVGEGEYPFQKFLRNYPNPENISGLAYKEHQSDSIIFQANKIIFDLQEYRNINPYEGEPKEILQNKILYLETSRGCPYKCEFCLASLDNKVRYYPIDTIFKTLTYLMSNGKIIKFLDRTFNIKKDFALQIFEFILKNHQLNHVFQFEITADILHPEIVQFIQSKVPKHLFRFEIGIQTVNSESNLAVSRKQNFEKTKKIIQQVIDYVEVHADLIVGLPFEGWKEIEQSFNQVFHLHPQELQLGFLKFLKGTPLRNPQKIQEHEYVFDTNAPYQIKKSKYLSENEIFELQIIENALEIYWNKARLKRTLKYLTPYCNMFELFWSLGKQFIAKYSFHQHSIDNVYDVAENFFQSFYVKYPEIQEILAIDYYSYFKLRPKQRFIKNLSIEHKKTVFNDFKGCLNKHQTLVLNLQYLEKYKNLLLTFPGYLEGKSLIITYGENLSYV